MSPILTWLALGLGFFFALNIGASGTAAAMGAAYGAGAIRRRPALWLVAICAMMGSVLVGQHVAVTLGKGLLPPVPLPAVAAAVILAAAAATLFASNLTGIPLSTSEVTVGAVIGTALVLGRPPWERIAVIAITWVALPLLSALFAFVMQRYASPKLRPYVRSRRRIFATLLTLGGCYEALAAGANNVANAVGPLIGAALVPMGPGVVVGGAGLGIGAVTMGGRVLNTNAKKITALDLLGGAMVSFTGASLVLAASLFGIPVPLTQVTTMGIVGVGYANGGLAALNPATLLRVARVWLLSPVISMAISFYGSTMVLPGTRPAASVHMGVLAVTLATALAARLLRAPRPAAAAPARHAERPGPGVDRVAESAVKEKTVSTVRGGPGGD